MIRSFLRYSLLATAVIACAGEPTSATLRPDSTPQAAKGNGGGAVMQTITMGPLATETSPPGDIAPMTSSQGGAVVSAVTAKSPFKNLSLANVSVTLNSATGDVSNCKLPGSTRTYSSSFGDNVGTWTGELDIWQGRSTALSNFKFNGTRTVNGVVETIQFTSNDDDAVQTKPDGATTVLHFDSVRLGLGSQSTHYDTVDGLPILRCVRVTVTATS